MAYFQNNYFLHNVVLFENEKVPPNILFIFEWNESDGYNIYEKNVCECECEVYWHRYIANLIRDKLIVLIE